MKTVFVILILLTSACLPLFSQNGNPDGQAENTGSVEEERRNTIRYGTESEIAALIQTLRAENAEYLDNDLASLVQGTANRAIVAGVFDFFAGRGREGLEERALRAVNEWDAEAPETVTAAINYLGKIKYGAAIEPLESLIAGEESAFRNHVFRALGRIGGGNEGRRGDIAGYLMDYYTERSLPDDSRQEIVTALGESKSALAAPFLSDLADNTDERLSIRMAAVGALSAIGDGGGLRAILDSAASTDPNLRSASIAALGPFSGPEVDRAILDAFRDNFWRTRIGACQAAGKRKIPDAVPYLEYRARHDEVPNVKDEAIRALAEIGSSAAITILESLFSVRSGSDRVRVLAAEMLMRDHADQYAAQAIIELDDAKRRSQNNLYNGLLRVLGTARTQQTESLAERLLSGSATEKSWALDMISANHFTRLVPQVELLADPRNGSIARKARSILESLGRD